MLAFWKLIVLLLITLTLIYWLLLAYSRSLRREALEKGWDAVTGQDLGPRESYIETGMAQYETSLRRKLLWLVYVLPIAVLTVLILVMNVQW
ncbi:MAG TPA: hypothetical protein VGC40_06050 [Paenirhodobacter sp.]